MDKKQSLDDTGRNGPALTQKIVQRLNEDRARGAVVPVAAVDAAAGERVASLLDAPDPGTEGLFSLGQLNRKRIIHPRMENRTALNSFRYLRRKVLEKMRDKKGGVILVSSAVEGGGGSFTAVNLAASLAFERDASTLLVECNPGHSDLVQLLEVKPGRGWLDVVDDPAVPTTSMITRTGIRDVDFLPSGSTTELPAELMGVKLLRGMFDELLAQRERFIVLDGPSLDRSEDPRIYSDIADCVVVVVPYGRISADKLRLSLRGIDKSKLAGAVINRSPAVW